MTHLPSIEFGGIEQTYPDLLSVLIILLFLAWLAIGAKVSLGLNNIMSVINILTITLIIVMGFIYADIDNWTNVEGGFAPFGFSGVIKGASTTFFSWVSILDLHTRHGLAKVFHLRSKMPFSVTSNILPEVLSCNKILS